MVAFLSSSLLFALIGARHNAKITVAFEDSFCKEPEGILWKQFTRLGKGQSDLTDLRHLVDTNFKTLIEM